ncbi:flagellar basal body-associated FliL family protein [Paenibacillus sp. DMB20]|uniref:flagellar basal body-associated FliL family protein n=1 Tax=Paenibacillus sp. DMB20 TaxID=1642570 RepID=UPI0006279638|nr:flagellar basal body-associated FliL family protein [Paenibacillus sp. DMB20]KKO53270.1 flagellar basal body protein FliL [Paenibacillus sp. DMB20]
MKKMLPWLITILLSITLIVVAIFLLSDKLIGGKEKEVAASQLPVPTYNMTADQIVEVTSEITDIKTNMADPDYIAMMSFAFQLNDKKAKEEFEKIKDIKIKPIIIKTLMDTKPESLKDSKGVEQLTKKLMDQINKSLNQGQLIQVDITNKIITGL